MSLDLNAVRADFADTLASNASHHHSLDAALMHVVEAAYQKGLTDALLVPAVLRDPLPDLDGTLAAGNRSAAGVELAASPAPGISGQADGSSPSGIVESGNDAVTCQASDLNETPKGGALARLAGMWCNDVAFRAWLKAGWPDRWARQIASGLNASGFPYTDTEIAGRIIRDLTAVKTRALLDHDMRAAAVFNRLIRIPYSHHLQTGKPQ